jgi:hypothetical protein
MSVKRYLSLAEIQLSRHALLQHYPEWVLRQGDTPRSGADPLTLADLDGDGRSVEDHRADWGPWVGREEELYIRCYETVRALTAEQLARLLGLDGDVHAAVLERLRLAVVEPQLPEKPRLNPGLSVRHLDDGSVAVAFHSEYDALALPAAAWRLLAEFRGTETLAGVRRRLREEHDADFSDEILTELHRHRVLI